MAEWQWNQHPLPVPCTSSSLSCLNFMPPSCLCCGIPLATSVLLAHEDACMCTVLGASFARGLGTSFCSLSLSL